MLEVWLFLATLSRLICPLVPDHVPKEDFIHGSECNKRIIPTYLDNDVKQHYSKLNHNNWLCVVLKKTPIFH